MTKSLQLTENFTRLSKLSQNTKSLQNLGNLIIDKTKKALYQCPRTEEHADGNCD